MRKKNYAKDYLSRTQWEKIEDSLLTHPTKEVNGIEIDIELVPLIKKFWVLGGRSYCCCQGPKMYNRLITSQNKTHITYAYDQDDEVICERPFIIIHKADLNLLTTILPKTKYQISCTRRGTEGFMCEWYDEDELPSSNDLLYVVLDKRV